MAALFGVFDIHSRDNKQGLRGYFLEDLLTQKTPKRRRIQDKPKHKFSFRKTSTTETQQNKQNSVSIDKITVLGHDIPLKEAKHLHQKLGETIEKINSLGLE